MALKDGFGLIQETDKEKNKKKTITRNVRGVESKATYDDDVSGLTAAAAGVSPFLEAAVGASGSNCRMLTSADTIDALLIDGGSSGESAGRFRIHVVMVDVSVNPVDSATVSTGT